MTLRTASDPHPASLAAREPTSDTAALLDSHQPLTARSALDARVRQLVPCAVRQQLWLLLLDADDVQLPIMIPIGDLPLRSDSADGEGLVELLGELAREFAVASFVFVLERPGAARLRSSDRQWLHFLLHTVAAVDYEIRQAYLCHSEGVVGYAADDVIGYSAELCRCCSGAVASSRPEIAHA